MQSTQKWIKRSKLVFNAPMLIERWKSEVKGPLRWIVRLWNSSLKIFEVLSQRGDVINRKLAWKRTKTCISCTNGDRKMELKSKRNFEVRYTFMELFSQNLEFLAPCCHVIISKLGQKHSNFQYHVTGGKKYYSQKLLTLAENFVSDVRISEFWNIDPRCYVIIPKLELSGQNLHLRHVFHLLEIALHKKWSFPSRISSVNVTKSAGNCKFGHIYWRIP